MSSICAILHLHSSHLTYGRLTALTLTRSIIRFGSCLQERLYQKPIREMDQLKQCLVEVWSDVQQTVIDAAIGEWRKRLWTYVCVKVHHFEHLL